MYYNKQSRAPRIIYIMIFPTVHGIHFFFVTQGWYLYVNCTNEKAGLLVI